MIPEVQIYSFNSNSHFAACLYIASLLRSSELIGGKKQNNNAVLNLVIIFNTSIQILCSGCQSEVQKSWE